MNNNNNNIFEKFRKANIDSICNKAIDILIYDNFSGVFYDKFFDEFFAGNFNSLVKYKDDNDVITLATFCITDFFGEGFLNLKYYKKKQEIERVYLSMKNDIISDCYETIRKIEGIDNHAKAAWYRW